MATRSSSTVRRRRLGAELRRLREAAGLSLEDAGKRLERAPTTISRIETGRVGVRLRDVQDLLELYGITDEQVREALLTLVRESRQKGWWHAYSDVLPNWFEVFVGLETAAASILTFEVQTIPGLLQTEAYAQTLFRAGKRFDTPDKLQRQVEVRMNRQAILAGEDPTELWVILDEAVLRRQVGGPAVMREQLDRLVRASEQPNITLQVLPFTAGAHMGMSTGFALFQFPDDPGDPPVVFVEHVAGGLYLEKAHEVRRYTMVFDNLRATALSPDDSVALIVRTTKEHHQ